MDVRAQIEELEQEARRVTCLTVAVIAQAASAQSFARRVAQRTLEGFRLIVSGRPAPPAVAPVDDPRVATGPPSPPFAPHAPPPTPPCRCCCVIDAPGGGVPASPPVTTTDPVPLRDGAT